MPATSYTRATATTVLQTAAQDLSGVYYTGTICHDALNLAMARVSRDARCRRATTTINVNAGQAEYDLTSITPRILDVLRAALPSSETDTNELDLQFATMEQIQATDATWRQTTGAPVAYMRWGQGFNLIRLYPEPTGNYTAIADASAAAFSGVYGGIISVTGLTDTEFDTAYGATISAAYKYGALRLDYVAASTDLSSDSDSLESVGGIPVHMQEAVIFDAMRRLFEIDVPTSQTQKIGYYEGLYQAEIAKASALVENDFQSKPQTVSYGEYF